MMQIGCVKWYDPIKGFGNLYSTKGESVFFHKSNCNFKEDGIKQGRAYAFKIENKDGKFAASLVRNLSYQSDLDLIQTQCRENPKMHYSVKVEYQKRFHFGTFFRNEEKVVSILKASLVRFFSDCKEDYFQLIINSLRQIAEAGDYEFYHSFLDAVLVCLPKAKPILHGDLVEEYRKINLGEEREYGAFATLKTEGRFLLEKLEAKIALPNDIELLGKLWESGYQNFQFPSEFYLARPDLLSQNHLPHINSLSDSFAIFDVLAKNRIDLIRNQDWMGILTIYKLVCEIDKLQHSDSYESMFWSSLFQKLRGLDEVWRKGGNTYDFRHVLRLLNGSKIEGLLSQVNNCFSPETLIVLWREHKHFEVDIREVENYIDYFLFDDLSYLPVDFMMNFFDEQFSSTSCSNLQEKLLLYLLLADAEKVGFNLKSIVMPDEFRCVVQLRDSLIKDSSKISFCELIGVPDGFALSHLTLGLSSGDLVSLVQTFNCIIQLERGIYRNRPVFNEGGYLREFKSKREKVISSVILEKRDIEEDLRRFLEAVVGVADRDEGSLLNIANQLCKENLVPIDKLVSIFKNLRLESSVESHIISVLSESLPLKERVDLWMEGRRHQISFEEIISGIKLFPVNRQFSVFRKFFSKVGAESLSPSRIDEFLEQIQAFENVSLDLEIAVDVLKNKRLSSEKDLTSIVCRHLNESVDGILQIGITGQLFEPCTGRKWIGERKDSWRLLIEGKEFELNYGDVEIDGISYSFNKEDKYVDVEGVRYPIKWVKKTDSPIYKIAEKPAGIEFCDAAGPVKDKEKDVFFHWCCNSRCYKPNQIDKTRLEWKSYSLRDFMRIMKVPFDQDQYYRFVSVVNRANRLLQKLKCIGCKNLLRDASSSEFAFYRVTTFHCTDPDCAEHHKKVYLTHCMNWRCNTVVDSRISKACPNGWYICDKCESCCSQQKLESRYRNLMDLNVFNPGNPRHQLLQRLVESKAGHLEKGETYDHRTGNLKN